MANPVTFWFEFASTYSYLSVMRIGHEAQKRGVDVIWKPFLLGPIFKAQGWQTSPFSIYPEKGQNMWRDVERRAEKYGLAFKRPNTFPQHSVLAARVAIVALRTHWGTDYCREIYKAQFASGFDISDPKIVEACVERAGGEAGKTMILANRSDQKEALRATVDEARSRGIYGAPSFIVDGELFWGDDRLEDALDWAHKD